VFPICLDIRFRLEYSGWGFILTALETEEALWWLWCFDVEA